MARTLLPDDEDVTPAPADGEGTETTDTIAQVTLAR